VEQSATETDEIPNSDVGSVVGDGDGGGDSGKKKGQFDSESSMMGESTEEEMREQEALERQRVIAAQQRLENLLKNVPRPEHYTKADAIHPREDRSKDCMEGRVRDFLQKCGDCEESILAMKDEAEAELERNRQSRKEVKAWFRNTAEAGIQTAIGEALDAIKGLAKLRGELLLKIDKQLSQNKSCIDEARSIKEAGQKLRDKVAETRRYTSSIGGEVDQLVQDWQDNVVNGKKHMLKEGGRFVKMAEKTVDRLSLIRCKEPSVIDDDIYTMMLEKIPTKAGKQRIFEIMGKEPMSPEGRRALGLPIEKIGEVDEAGTGGDGGGGPVLDEDGNVVSKNLNEAFDAVDEGDNVVAVGDGGQGTTDDVLDVDDGTGKGEEEQGAEEPAGGEDGAEIKDGEPAAPGNVTRDSVEIAAEAAPKWHNVQT